MEIMSIPKINIKLNPKQHREDLGNLEPFTKDIEKRGLINPITVVKDLEEIDKYVLVAGQRRLAAYPYDKIPCHVMDSSSGTSAAENLMRKSIEPYEKAVAYRELEKDGYSYEQIADMVDDSMVSDAHQLFVKGGHNSGKRIKTSSKIDDIKKHLKIFTYPVEIQNKLKMFPHLLSMRHLDYIMSLDISEEDKVAYAETVITEELTTSELRHFIQYFKTMTTRREKLKSLKEYREENPEADQERFIDLYGFVPDSCWYSLSSDNKDFMKFINIQYATQVGGSRGYEGSYTQFLPELAYRVISFWSNEGDVLVDPMAGDGTRGMMSWALGRNTHMFDCDTKQCRILSKRVRESTIITGIDKHNDAELMFAQCDSRHMPIASEFADIVFSCPPYWNKEVWRGDGQLSKLDNYEEFMIGLSEIFKDCFRILKKDKFMVMVVGDFRDSGKYYTFHNDVIKYSENIGFTLWDIVISKITTNISVKLPQALEFRRTVKNHEYILVFKK